MQKFSWKKIKIPTSHPIFGVILIKQSEAYKLAVALLVSFLVGIIIILTGLVQGIRLSVVLYRVFVGMAACGMLVFGLEMLLDFYGVPLFVEHHGDMKAVWRNVEYEDDFIFQPEKPGTKKDDASIEFIVDDEFEKNAAVYEPSEELKPEAATKNAAIPEETPPEENISADSASPTAEEKAPEKDTTESPKAEIKTEPEESTNEEPVKEPDTPAESAPPEFKAFTTQDLEHIAPAA